LLALVWHSLRFDEARHGRITAASRRRTPNCSH
jgi:hypothetical protein